MDNPLIDQLLIVQRAVQRTSYCIAAGTAIYVLDYFLTFRDEMKYVWTSRLSLVKVLFLVSRYLPVFVYALLFRGVSGLIPLSIVTCQRLIMIIALIISCLMVLWNWVTAIRVHALYGMQPRMKYFLMASLPTTACISLGFTIRYTLVVAQNTVVVEDFEACTAGTNFPRYYVIVWIPSMVLEIVLFFLAMKQLLNLNRLKENKLMRLILRDGALYFVVLMAFRIANLALFFHADVHNVYFAVFIMVGVGSSLVSRLVLNLKSWSSKSRYYNDDAATRFKSPSDVQIEMTYSGRTINLPAYPAKRGRMGPGWSYSYGESTTVIDICAQSPSLQSLDQSPSSPKKQPDSGRELTSQLSSYPYPIDLGYQTEEDIQLDTRPATLLPIAGTHNQSLLYLHYSLFVIISNHERLFMFFRRRA